ncbi:unnamed protein product, partial [Arabidopsis halleri]
EKFKAFPTTNTGAIRLPAFYVGVYEAVDDPSLNSIISWSTSNRSFIIWNPEEFHRRILSTSVQLLSPDYSTFFSQLDFHGFQRIKGSGHLEFGDTYFVRGKPELMKEMRIRSVLKRIQKAREEELEDRLPLLRI